MAPSAEWKTEGEQHAVTTPSRIGRAPATTHGELSAIALELFLERGYEETTVDDIAAAAGIGRRTLFRYFPSKNDLPWGDFDALLAIMRAHLSDLRPDLPIMEALREAWHEKRMTSDDIWHYAKVCRVANVMRPYLESLV